MELISSISNCSYDEIFYQGFTTAYYQLTKILKTNIISIENISHNQRIIKYISKLPFSISQRTLFLYNYATYSIDSSKIFIIL